MALKAIKAAYGGSGMGECFETYVLCTGAMLVLWNARMTQVLTGHSSVAVLASAR